MKNLPPVDPMNYQPLRQQVYELIRDAIISGYLQPGEPITEIKIAEHLKVSRTPAREAMRMLELEGLIVITPRRGAFIAGIKSTKEINDIFTVRMTLEELAASLASQNMTSEQFSKLNEYDKQIHQCLEDKDVKRCIKIDHEFHQIIYQSSENELLQKFLDSLFEQITRFRTASLSNPGRMEQALIEHRQLMEAIAAHDSKLAKKIAVEHMKNAWQNVLTVFNNPS